MILYLLRHGEAENIAEEDAKRALTNKGRQQIEDVAQQFLAKNQRIDVCYASPFVRAQETAHLFLSFTQQSQQCVNTLDCIRPESPAQEVIAFLSQLKDEKVLLVTHNPLVSELIALFEQGNIHHLRIVGTGELNCLSFDLIGLGIGEAEFTLSPKA